jgi:uncharacterized protein YaaR (DUF327 family)
MEVRRTSRVAVSHRTVPAAAPPRPAPVSVPPVVWTSYRAAEEELLELPTYDTLKRYKRAVQELMARTLASQEPTTDLHVSRHGFKRLVYVHALEQSLDEITSDRLREWSGVQLLQRLDLVRGLLVDLFA